MLKEIINGYDLQKMFVSGLALLTGKHKEVDMLNVFPVPDGDTGTNMYLTLAAAVDEAGKSASRSVNVVAEDASRGALMGARGNSGVILSQLFRGFSRSLKGKENISGKEFAKGLVEGVDLAVKAVMKPVEGTILTVARTAAQAAVKASDKGLPISRVLEEACLAAESTLKKTPDMLPALKEAGVVDAGGMGWLIILQGLLSGLTGQQQDLEVVPSRPKTDYSNINLSEQTEPIDFKYPYCTEVLIKTCLPVEQFPINMIESKGDSLLVAAQDGLIKIHVHTAHPGEILEHCLKHGPLVNVKINNMNQEAAEAASRKASLAEVKELKPFGIISVASGEGIVEIMKSLGADEIIAGGQSMNPSIQQLLDAVEKINAETVIILPNNSNILLSSNQVPSITDKKVTVVPTQSIPQGLSALLSVTPVMKADDAVNAMLQAVKNVKSGEITYAVRDTVIKGRSIKKGDIIGLCEDEIISGTGISETVTNLLKKMISPENEVCSLYYGEETNKDEAETLVHQLTEVFPDIEFDLQFGGQPIYYYLISVE